MVHKIIEVEIITLFVAIWETLFVYLKIISEHLKETNTACTAAAHAREADFFSTTLHVEGARFQFLRSAITR